jgi:DNA-binding transcriptional regulator WhiA
MSVKLDEIAPKLAEAFSGQHVTSQYHDAVKKIFILVASGEQAEQFRKVVDAVRSLAHAERRRAKQEQAETAHRSPKASSGS